MLFQVEHLLKRAPVNNLGNDLNSSRLIEHECHYGTQGMSSIKILDVAGLVVDRRPEQDSETLVVLSNYLQTQGQQQRPSAIIVVSSYDDNRAGGESSHFVQMLKRVQLLNNQLLISKSNITNFVFLFTQVGRDRSASRRAVQRKLDTFRNIIKNYTEFEEPIVTVVGENNGPGYGLLQDANGFTLLRNGERYPKNLFDAIKQIATRLRDAAGEAAANFLTQNYRLEHRNTSLQPSVREVAYEAVSQACDSCRQQKAALLRHLIGEIMQVNSSSMVSAALQNAWDTRIEAGQRAAYPTALVELQKTFQTLGIGQRSQLPSTTPQIVALFLRLPSTHEIFGQLLWHAFSIKQPQLFVPLVAGFGYDLVTDSVLEESPWNLSMNAAVPTRLGYRLPPEYTVTLVNETRDIFEYLSDVSEYVPARMQDLSGEVVNNSNVVSFRGQVRPAYNVKPLPEDVIHYSGTAIREFRMFSLEISEELELSSEFLQRLARLRAFNASDRESEKEWNNFFNVYGTHVVMSVYGGGYMQGTVRLGSKVKFLEGSQGAATRQSLKQTLLEFTSVPAEFLNESVDATAEYNFFGGSPKAKMQHMLALGESDQRGRLLSEWLESVRLTPTVLESALTLRPISQVVAKVNVSIATYIEGATQLLYAGNLKYTPPRRNRTRTTTAAPRPETTTIGTTMSSASGVSKLDVTVMTATPESTPATATTTVTMPTAVGGLETSVVTATPASTTPAPIIRVEPPSDSSFHFIPNSDLHVGFGYNMFYDLGVPRSPFDLGALKWIQGPAAKARLRHYEKANVTAYTKESIAGRCVILASRRDYIQRRIQDLETVPANSSRCTYGGCEGTWTKWSRIDPPIEANFHYSTVKPGYTILGSNSSSSMPHHINSVGELGLFKVDVGDWKHRLTLSDEFQSDLLNLQATGSAFQRGCAPESQLSKQIAFFKKYGTHVLVARNVGYSVQATKRVKVPSSWSECDSPDKSVRQGLMARCRNSKQCPIQLRYLDLDMEFEELGTIVRQVYGWEAGSDVNAAILEIYDSKLRC